MFYLYFIGCLIDNVALFVLQSAKSLQNNKDSRILWAKDDFLITTGFDSVRSLLYIYIYFVQWVLQDHTIVSSESDTEQIEEKVTIGILHKHQYSFKRLIKLK